MDEITILLPDFPGFAVRFHGNDNPFFRLIMEENLRKLKTVPIGESLLHEIQQARPAVCGSFPMLVNIIFIPHHLNFTQCGYKRNVMYDEQGKAHVFGMTATNQASFSPPDRPFWMPRGSHNWPVDMMAASNDTGSVCFLKFSNVHIVTGKGEPTYPFVVLAHELIHCLQGRQKDGKDEELWTTGIGKYSDNPMSENSFRRQFGLPLRTEYF
ncbi:hypothetical protein GCM10023116_36730 [Kistimonas scapharcae]|uniref:Uncharacterized protein n=1 Tax=Kistimonas scapharcae TaxID=1036133 RepID=A0ABP8V7J3_9GAMM